MKPILITLLSLFTFFASQAQLKTLTPTFWASAIPSEVDLKDYTVLLDIVHRLDKREISEEDLNSTEAALYDRWDELEDAMTIGGLGCSWYCGGGPHKITASSQLGPEKGFLYEPDNAHDFDATTAWVEGAKGDGIGEFITYHFMANSPPVTKVEVYNGYLKDENTWKVNGRVKKLKMYVDNVPFAILEVADNYNQQVFNLGTELQSTVEGTDMELKFEILEVYPGTMYHDVAISEILFDGTGVHCFAKGTMITMADGSLKPIETITIQDSVLSLDIITSQSFSAGVMETTRIKHHNLVRISLINGAAIELTSDHPVFTNNKGWASLDPEATKTYNNIDSASMLETMDEVVVYREGRVVSASVQKIEMLESCQETYSILDLHRGNAFFANGIVVGTEVLTQQVATK